jgi:hypothetical protein
VIELCNELLHKIEESLNLERFAEDKRVEAYKKARHLLVLSLTAANVDLANVSTELASYDDDILILESTIILHRPKPASTTRTKDSITWLNPETTDGNNVKKPPRTTKTPELPGWLIFN